MFYQSLWCTTIVPELNFEIIDMCNVLTRLILSVLNFVIQLLGINAFTVILAALIVFFLSMNVVLGPGWLGSQLGIPGTGSIQEVSPSLPGSIDLNKPEFRL